MNQDYLLDWLDAFNRKERYYLVSHALGGFELSDAFRTQLGEQIGRVVPADCRAWMDFHLDWVYAALQLRASSPSEPTPEDMPSPDFRDPTASADSPSVYVNQNQEDIDLLVAFRDQEETHLVFVEAKGETSWSNSQTKSKVMRLTKIFADPVANVLPAFVLASPRQPQHLVVPDGSASWIAPGGAWRWMVLPQPEGRRRIQRWDAAKKAPDKGSTNWRVVPTRKKGAKKAQS